MNETPHQILEETEEITLEEHVKRQVATLHKMKLRNNNWRPIDPRELGDMIEKTFEELELDLKGTKEYHRWYLKIIRSLGLTPRCLSKKSRKVRVSKRALEVKRQAA